MLPNRRPRAVDPLADTLPVGTSHEDVLPPRARADSGVALVAAADEDDGADDYEPSTSDVERAASYGAFLSRFERPAQRAGSGATRAA